MIHHVGIRVAELGVSLDFYTRLLGLQLEEVVELGGQKFYFLTDGKMRLELEPAVEGGAAGPLGRGLSHLALAVSDLAARAAALKAAGVRFLLEPIQLRPDRKIAFVEDPDGVAVQLIEFLENQRA